MHHKKFLEARYVKFAGCISPSMQDRHIVSFLYLIGVYRNHTELRVISESFI
jgi:hypothetical protein